MVWMLNARRFILSFVFSLLLTQFSWAQNFFQVNNYSVYGFGNIAELQGMGLQYNVLGSVADQALQGWQIFNHHGPSEDILNIYMRQGLMGENTFNLMLSCGGRGNVACDARMLSSSVSNPVVGVQEGWVYGSYNEAAFKGGLNRAGNLNPNAVLDSFGRPLKVATPAEIAAGGANIIDVKGVPINTAAKGSGYGVYVNGEQVASVLPGKLGDAMNEIRQNPNMFEAAKAPSKVTVAGGVMSIATIGAVSAVAMGFESMGLDGLSKYLPPPTSDTRPIETPNEARWANYINPAALSGLVHYITTLDMFDWEWTDTWAGNIIRQENRNRGIKSSNLFSDLYSLGRSFYRGIWPPGTFDRPAAPPRKPGVGYVNYTGPTLKYNGCVTGGNMCTSRPRTYPAPKVANPGKGTGCW